MSDVPIIEKLMKTKVEKLAIIRKAKTALDLALLDKQIGLSYSYESYRETYERLEAEGSDVAIYYKAIWERWNQIYKETVK